MVGSAGEEEEEAKKKWQGRKREGGRTGRRKGRCGKPRTRPQKSPLVDLKFPKDTEKITRLAALSGGGWPVTALGEREAERGRRGRDKAGKAGRELMQREGVNCKVREKIRYTSSLNL